MNDELKTESKTDENYSALTAYIIAVTTENISEKIEGIDNLSDQIRNAEDNSKRKSLKNKSNEFVALSQSLSTIETYLNTKAKISDNQRKELSSLSSALEEKELKKIQQKLNSAVNKSNKKANERIQKREKEAKKLVDKLGIRSEKAPYIEDGVKVKDIRVGNAIDSYCDKKIENSDFHFSVSKDKKELDLPDRYKEVFDYLDDMSKGNKKVDSKAIKKMIKEKERIKQAIIEREKLYNTISKLNNSFDTVRSVKDIDNKKVIKYMVKIQKKYRSFERKNAKYLNQFDLGIVERKIEENEAALQAKKEQEQKFNAQKDLAYQIEKTKEEHPKDIQKISELEDQLREANSRVKPGEIPDAKLAMSDGERKYKSDKFDEDIKNKSFKSETKASDNYENERKLSEKRTIFNEEAKKEIKEPNIYSSIYFLEDKKDPLYDDQYKEKIERREHQLERFWKMSPLERGLENLKAQGIVDENATLDDLTDVEKINYKTTFADEQYPFIAELNKIFGDKKDSYDDPMEIKSSGNVVYKNDGHGNVMNIDYSYNPRAEGNEIDSQVTDLKSRLSDLNQNEREDMMKQQIKRCAEARRNGEPIPQFSDLINEKEDSFDNEKGGYNTL